MLRKPLAIKEKLLDFAIISIAMILVAGCAVTPKFQLDNVNHEVLPAQAVTDFSAYKNTRTLWGGIIVSSRNLKQGSLLEVLSYPLDDNYKPDTQESPLGRFIVEHTEYLETVNYAAGRLLTVVGPLLEIRKGTIGEAEYLYPVLTGEQLFLWPTEDQNTEPRIQFGFGVMIHN